MTFSGASAAHTIDTQAEPGLLRLRVLATSDLHAHLFPFNYFTDCRDDGVGLATLAALIQRARSETPNTVLFDNGDTFQGGPLADAALSEMVPQGDVHPMIAAMNALGYDAATLGNHDFDFGLDVLDRVIAPARYPVVLANARRVGGGGNLVVRHAILDRNLVDDAGAVRPLRIGVTGAIPPQVMRWARPQLNGQLEVEAILPAIQREVGNLRAKGADLVIVLAHSGLGADADITEGENVGRLLARLDGVDAVIAGHTHRLFPRPDDPTGLIDGVPLVQPGCWGSHLGQIDLTLRPCAKDTGGGGPEWQVHSAKASLRANADATATDRASLRNGLQQLPVFRRQMARGHRLTRAHSARPLGETAVALETYFSLIAPCAATQVIADAQRAAVARLLAGRDDLAGLPLISVVTPFKAGGRGGPGHYSDVPMGAVLLRHAADLYAYANGLAVVCATGAQIRAWLERSVSAFCRIDPARSAPQPLIDMDFASYNFDRMEGLRYDIDLTQEAMTNATGDVIRTGVGRIRNLRLCGGAPVRAGDKFLLITSAYRAAGGGHFPDAAECQVVFSTPNPVRSLLINHITNARKPLNPVIEPSFAFMPMGGAQVVVHTGAGAAAHPGRARALGLAPDGIDSNGFARYLLKI